MKPVSVRYMGCVDYADAWRMQTAIFERLLAAKSNNAAKTGGEARQEIVLLQHPHVYTLGKSGSENNLLVDPAFLERIGATYFRTDRGGDVTYHGPGQLVGSPILDLEELGMGLKDYIDALEQAVIDTVAEYDIEAGRQKGATGVWVEGPVQSGAAAKASAPPRKICAIGVRASRYVTMHGFALNVTTDLGYFSHINPCGFTDRGVTSIERETGLRPEVSEVAEKFIKNFARLTGIEPAR